MSIRQRHQCVCIVLRKTWINVSDLVESLSTARRSWRLLEWMLPLRQVGRRRAGLCRWTVSVRLMVKVRFFRQWLGGFLPGGKTARSSRWPLPSNAEIKNECSCNFTPPICFHGMHWDSFAFTFTFTSFRSVISRKTGIFNNAVEIANLIYLCWIVEARGTSKVGMCVAFPWCFLNRVLNAPFSNGNV